MIEVDAQHKSFSKFRFWYFDTPKSAGFSFWRRKQVADNGKEISYGRSAFSSLPSDTSATTVYNVESIRDFHMGSRERHQARHQNIIKIDDAVNDTTTDRPGRFQQQK